MRKRYDIKITLYAKQQLIAIKNYILKMYSATSVVQNLLTKFSVTFKSLEYMPKRHKIISEAIGRRENIRKIKQNNFYVYYWVNDENNTVYILDIVYVKANQDLALKMMYKVVEKN